MTNPDYKASSNGGYLATCAYCSLTNDLISHTQEKLRTHTQLFCKRGGVSERNSIRKPVQVYTQMQFAHCTCCATHVRLVSCPCPRHIRAHAQMLLTSLGRSLLPWTIIEVNEDTYTFEALFTSIQGGRFDAVTISESARLLRSLVGHKRDELKIMATSNGLSVLEVCQEFGKFVRFSVELSS